MEIVDIVDGHDRVIGKASRKDAHQKNLLHRIVHIIIENSKSQILATLTRSESMDVWPGYISNVGGHVNCNESYEEAAKRELLEEIGVRGKLEFLGKVNVKDGKYSHMVGCFRTKSDGPFKLDRTEIEKIEFKSIKKIRAEIGKGKKYTPTFIAVFKKVYPGL